MGSKSRILDTHFSSYSHFSGGMMVESFVESGHETAYRKCSFHK